MADELEQLTTELRTLYKRRIPAHKAVDTIVDTYLQTSPANRESVDRFLETSGLQHGGHEDVSAPNMRHAIDELFYIREGQPFHAEASQLIPHLRTIEETRIREAVIKPRIRELVQSSKIDAHFRNAWLAAEQEFHAPPPIATGDPATAVVEDTGKRAVEITEAGVPAASREAEQAGTNVAGRIEQAAENVGKEATKSGSGKTKWIVGITAAVVAIGAFLMMSKKSKVEQENERRAQVTPQTPGVV